MFGHFVHRDDKLHHAKVLRALTSGPEELEETGGANEHLNPGGEDPLNLGLHTVWRRSQAWEFFKASWKFQRSREAHDGDDDVITAVLDLIGSSHLPNKQVAFCHIR